MILVCFLMVFGLNNASATNYYTWTNGTPTTLTLWWTGTAGTGTHPANFTAAGDSFIVQNNNTMTTTANWTVTGTVKINSGCTIAVTSGGTAISLGSLVVLGTLTQNRNLTVSGATIITGTITFASTTAGARTMTFTGDVTLNAGAVWTELATGNGSSDAFNFGGNFTNNATTFTAVGTGIHTFSGTTKTLSGSTATTFKSLSITNSITNNLTNGLTVSTALAGAGALTQGANTTLNITGTSAITTLTTTTNTPNTVNYNGAVQTVKPTTYYNLTLSGSGAKTMTSVTVNDTLSMEGTSAATASVAPTYGAAAALQYNTTNALTTGPEWVTPFTGTGGIIIKNTGAISLAAAKTIGSSTACSPLKIISGATLTPGANLLTLFGNFVNAGTLTSGSGGITLTGTCTQSIDGYTTTGTTSMTKTGGTATFTGNVSGAALTINGTGGTLNLGSSLTHTFTGDITLTAGTLNGGTTSILNVNSSTATAWNGTGSVFSAGTGTVVFGGTTPTVSASATTFNNVTISGAGSKTITTANFTVNGILSMESTGTLSAAPTYGSAATLQYNTATSRTAGVEWITPFIATGGVIIKSTGTITLNAAKVLGNNTNVPLNINSGATLNTSASNYSLTFQGDFINAGTLTAGSSNIIISGTTSTQNIGGFTTTGDVSMTKTSGTATLTGNVNGGTLTINGSGGTLNLGSILTHTFTGTWTRTAGTLNGGSSTLNLAGSVSGSGGTFTASSGTVGYNASGTQTIAAVTYNNLVLSGSGVKTFPSAITNIITLTINGSASADLGTNISSCATLILGSTTQTGNTSYGGTGTHGSFVNTTYFAAGTGQINVSLTCITPSTLTAVGTNVSCQGGNNGSIALTISGGSTPYNYLWTGGSTLQNPTGLSAGTYNLVVTANGGCTAALSPAVTITYTYTTPTANAGSVLTSICQGGTSAALGGSVGGSATGGIWSDGGAGGTFNSGATSLNTTYSPLTYYGSVTLTLTTTGGSCGTASATKSLSVTQTNTAPTVSINVTSGTNPACGSGGALTITATQTYGGTGSINYAFTKNHLLSQSGSSASYAVSSFNDNDSIFCILTVTGGTCLASSTAGDTLLLGVNAYPQGSINANGPFCSGGGTGNVTWTPIVDNGPYSVTYTFTGGSTTTATLVDSATAGNVMPNGNTPVTITSTTTYTVTNVTDNIGCTTTTGFTVGSATITVDAAFSGGTLTSSTQTICYNSQPSNITYSTAPSGGTTPQFQWYQQTGSITVPTGAFSVGSWTPVGTTSTSTPTLTGATIGNLSTTTTFALRVTDVASTACYDNWAGNAVVVTVEPTMNYGTINNTTQTLCSNNGSASAITFTSFPTGSGNFTYQWYSGSSTATCPTGTSTSGWTSVGSGSGGATNSFTPPLTVGTIKYACFVTPTGSPTCGTATWATNCQTVTVTALPTASISYSGSPWCTSAGTQAVSLTGTAGGTYTSAAGLSIGSSSGLITPSTSTPGSYTVSYTVSASAGCSAVTATASVTINQIPSGPTAGSNSPVCSGSALNLTLTLGTTGTPTPTYSWSGPSSYSSTAQNPTISSAANSGTYSVTATNSCGSTNTSVVVTVTSSGVWKGTTSTDWFTSSNWCGGTPTASTNVSIPSGGTQPTIGVTAGTGLCNNITINPSATLTITGSNGLTVSGNWVNNGTFTGGASSTVTFNGATQSIGGTSSNTFNNFSGSTSGTKTAAGNITVNGALTISSGVILDMTSSYILSGTLGTISNSGTIQTAVPTATSATPIPSGKTWGGTVTYSASSGLQTIVTGTYNNLISSNTSSTNTVGGDLTVNGTFTTTAGGTVNMGTNQLLGTLTASSAGIIQTQNTGTTPIPSGKTWGGTVNYNASSGGQNIITGTYSTIITGNTSGTSTASGTITATSLNTTSGGTLNMSTYQLLGVTSVSGNLGTLTTQYIGSSPIPSGLTWGGTVTYNASTGGQSVSSGTYSTLTMGNSSGTQNTSGNLILATLNNNTNSTIVLNLGANTLTATNINNAGTIRTQNTSGTPIAMSPLSIAGTVTYDAATGGQTIVTGTYITLTMGNNSGVQTANGAISATTLNNNTNSVDSLNMVTYALNANTINNTGTIRTQNISSSPFPASLTWGGKVTYDALTGGQTIMTGNYSTLTTGNTSNTSTASGAISAITLNTTSGGTLNMSTFALTSVSSGSGNAGTIQTQNTGTAIPTGLTWAGTVNFNNASGGQTVSALAFNNLSLGNTSGIQTTSGNISVNGALVTTSGGILDLGSSSILGGTLSSITNGGTIKTSVVTSTSATPIPSGRTWGGIINYYATSGSQTIMAGTYTTLTTSNSSGTQTASGSISCTTLNTTSGGTLNMGTNTLTVSGTPSNSGIINTQNTSVTPISAGKTWGGTINYNASGVQTVINGTYNNLTLSGSGAKTITTTTTVNGTLSIQGTATAITGTIAYGASGTLEYAGSASQTTSSIEFLAAGVPNLSVSNSNGVILNGNGIVTGTVTFNNGIITTNSNRLIVGSAGSAGSFSGNGTGKYVYGNLRLYIPNSSAPTVTFPVGDASNYTPASLAFLGTVSGSGYIDLNTSTGAPSLASGLSQSQYVNRKWTITNTGVTGFTSYSPTFTFVGGDLVGSPSTSSLIIRNLNGSSWFTTTAGVRTSLSTQATGIASFGDFVIGIDACSSTSNIWLGGTSSDWNIASNWCNGIPNALTDVTILSGQAFQPTIGSAGGLCKSIIINGSATLTINSTYSLTVSGDWTNNGTFTPNSSVVTFNGTAQSIGGSGTNSFYSLSLINSGTKTALSNIGVQGTLTLASGVTLDLTSSYLLSGTLGTISNSGIIKTSVSTATSATPIPTGKIWGGTINFAASSGLQTIVSGTYSNLTSGNSSSTNSIGGDITVNGVLTTTSGGILNLGTNQLLGSPSNIINGGTIQTQNTGSTPIPSGLIWDGTIQYNSTNGGQTIISGTYSNLTLSNTSGIQSAGGTITVNGTLVTSSSGLFDLGSNQLLGALTSITNNGTIKTQNSSSTPIPTGKTWGGTIQYYNATGGQTIMTGTYNTLTLSNTSGTQTASGAIAATNLNTTSGGTFNLGINLLSGLSSVSNSGTIRTQNTTSTPITTGLSWGGTVQYDASSGGQPINASSFNNLTLSNTSGSQTAGGNITVSATLTTTSGGTLDMGSAYILGGTLSTITNGGTIKTAVSTSTSSTPIASGKNWGSGTVNYYAASGAQTIMTGTYGTLTMSNSSGTQTAGGAISASTLNIASGGTLNMFTYALSGLSTVSNSGTLETQNTSSSPFTGGLIWGGTVLYDGSLGQTIPSPASTFNNLTINNTAGVTAASNQNVNGILYLNVANPNSTTGSLSMPTNDTLFMGASSTTTGTGDVTGIINRTHTFLVNTNYTFGNTNQLLIFPIVSGQTLPSSVTVKVTIGTAPSWVANSTKRYYDVAQTGASGTKAIYRTSYLQSELANGVNESLLSFFSDVSNTVTEQGWSNYDINANWITLSNVNLGMFPSTLGTFEVAIAPTAGALRTWNGSINTVWDSAENWTPQGVPTSAYGIIIPDVSTSNSISPILPAGAVGSYIIIETNGVLNAASGATLTLSGPNNEWSAEANGVFNAGSNSTVIFAGSNSIGAVAIAGTTTFNNLTITDTTLLRPGFNSYIGVTGTLSLSTTGVLAAATNDNTIEFMESGTYTIPNPNGTLPGYHNLLISGSGTKNLPTPLYIAGDFTNNGTINAGSGTVIMSSISGSNQNIGGTSTTSFYNLSIEDNYYDITTTSNITVGGTLNVYSNCILKPGAVNTIGGSGTLTGSGTVEVTRITSTPDFNTQFPIATKTLTNLNVDYEGAGDQSVNALNYFNLTIEPNGTRNVTLANSGTIGISGVFTPDLTVTSYTNTGSTVNFNGSSSQTIPAFKYNNLTSSSTGARTLASSDTVGIAGVFTAGSNTYTVTGSTVNFNGTTQSISGFTLNNLVASNSGTKTATGNLVVNGGLTVASGVTLDMTSSYTLAGSMSFLSSSGTVKTAVPTSSSASPLPSGQTWAGTVEYYGSSAQTVMAGTYNNLTMSGAGGGTTSGDITVNGTLSLSSSNPSSTQGLLSSGSNTLYMGVSSTTTGAGDVTGIVERQHVFTSNIEYTFGSQNTSLVFLNTGTNPGWVKCKIAIGNAPSWKTGAVKRYYSFAKDAGDNRVTVKLHYLDAEINSPQTDESQLVFWDAKGVSLSTVAPHGKTSNDATNNFVTLTGMSIHYVTSSSSLDVKQWGLAYSDANPIRWTGEGAFPGDWSLPGNWYGGVPSASDSVLIPAGLSYAYPYRNLYSNVIPAVAKSIKIESGASISVDTFTITVSGATGAWLNNGTFTPGTGNVIFNNGSTSNTVTLSGTTDFYNLTVAANTKIQPATSSVNNVAGAITAGSGSILDFTTNVNTFGYNGVSQTVINPNGSTPGYYHLNINGTGTSALPSGNLNIIGDFTNNGTVANNSGTVILNGVGHGQNMGGTSTTDFNNLTLSNTSAHITTTGNIAADGNLTVNSSVYFKPGATNTVGGSGTLTGGGTVAVTRITSTPDFNTQFPITSKTLTNLTVEYEGAGDQTVNALNYGNLTVEANGSRTVTLASSGTIGVSGVFNPDATLTAYTNTGSTINFNGSSSQTIPAFMYNNLTSSASGARTLASSDTVGVAGAFTPGSNSYTVSGSTVKFNGTNQNIPGFTFNNLFANNSGVKTAIGNLIVNGNLTVASLDTVDMTSSYTLSGTLSSITNNGKIRTAVPTSTSSTPLPSGKTWGGTIEYYGSSSQTVVSGTYNNLTMSGAGGGTTAGNIILSGVLALSNSNPSSTQGLLHTGSDTLEMGINGTLSGSADVTGNVKRTGTLAANIAYTYGNLNTSIAFLHTGTTPPWVNLAISIGTSPSWKADAIQRYYTLKSGTGNDRMIIKCGYLPSELNGNTESNLSFWDGAFSSNPTVIFSPGKTSQGTDYISLTGQPITGFSTSSIYSQVQISLGNKPSGPKIWTGLANYNPGDWSIPANWYGGVPDESDTVLIPTTLPAGNVGYPITNGLSDLLPAKVKTLTIQPGASITVDTFTLTIYGDSAAWVNEGTFYPGTGTVVFNNNSQVNTATLSGTTNFYNLTLAANSSLQAMENSITRIAGTLTQGASSDMDFSSLENHVEYNGTDQNVIQPLGSDPGYADLIISGSGTKTFPSGNLNIMGEFINNGTIDANGGTVIFDDDFDVSPASISGTSSTTFYNLQMNKMTGLSISGSHDATVTNQLTFTNGRLVTNANKIILGSSCAAATISGAGNTSYIDGNLRVYVPNASSPTVALPIGDATYYTPATIAFTGSTSGCGYLDAFTTVEAPPTGALPTGAFLNYAKYVKRSWTINNTGVTFSSPYSASFTFAPTDIQGGGDPTKFVVRKYDAPNWSKTTDGTRTSTSTQCIGSNSFSKFVIGEANDTKGMPLYMFR